MKSLITRLLAAHHIRKARRWKAQRIHSNRDAYRMGFRRAERKDAYSEMIDYKKAKHHV